MLFYIGKRLLDHGWPDMVSSEGHSLRPKRLNLVTSTFRLHNVVCVHHGGLPCN